MRIKFSFVILADLSCSPCDRPRVIESLRGIEVVDIAAGGAHSACVTSAGDLYTWGKGRYGRLGHSDSEDQLKPKLVRRRWVWGRWVWGRGFRRFRVEGHSLRIHKQVLFLVEMKTVFGLYSVGHVNRMVQELCFYLY